MESKHRIKALEHKTVAGGKGIEVACEKCTYLNALDVSSCGMCGERIKIPTHDVQADGSWICGGCETVNRRAAKQCSQCRLRFYSLVTTAVPAQIFCSRCGFLNDGDNVTCVQCDYTIRSTLDKISSDLKDSTNSLARDMGMNIHVKCPGCLVVCYVPPATACLRCGSCHTYFASPSVGEVTNFHMSRLASSISSSFMGLFGGKRGGQEIETTRVHEEAREAPVARLIAAGQSVLKSPRHLSTASDASELFTSVGSEANGEEIEEKVDASEAQEGFAEPNVLRKTSGDEEIDTTLDKGKCDMFKRDMKQRLSSSDDTSSSFCHSGNKQPMFARSMPLRAALPVPRQELVQVEGDIVEL